MQKNQADFFSIPWRHNHEPEKKEDVEKIVKGFLCFAVIARPKTSPVTYRVYATVMLLFPG